MILRFNLILAALFSTVFIVVLWVGLRDNNAVLRLGSTTSTKDSGLLDHLIPLYEANSGIDIVLIAKGTGAAIRDGLNGQIDALLVHNHHREQKLIDQSFALSRQPIMSNTFLIVGSKAQTQETDDLELILQQFVLGKRGLFLSRGDDSGTHAAELRLWAHYGLNPSTFGNWYATTGTGMGQTLITANANGAATLVDEATWARHKSRGDLAILFRDSGDDEPLAILENLYSYLVLNPDKIPGIQKTLAEDFGIWLSGPEGQAAIAAYHIEGMQVFRPYNASF